MTIVEVLRAARARIERGWCQGCCARDASGQRINPFAPEAVAWCVFGAIDVGSGRNSEAFEAASNAIEKLVGDPARWNDLGERTQLEVIQLVDRAITLAESEASP